MGWVTYQLDEVRPFRDGDWTLEILVYGEATIKYRAPDDWWLEDLEIDAAKRSPGSYATTRQPIDKASVLFIAIAEHLSREHSDDIAEMIRDDMRAQHEIAQFDEGKERAKLGMAS